MTAIQLYSSQSYTRFCDFVVSDDHYMPPLRVVTAVGDADGDDIAWTASAGDRYACLDDLPRSMTDYIYSSTVAAENSVKVPALPISGSVHTVVQQIYARKSDTDIRRIKQFVKSGTKSYGNAITLTGTETIYVRKMDVNPVTSSAWQTSDFGATGAQFGVRVDS